MKGGVMLKKIIVRDILELCVMEIRKVDQLL